MHATVLSVALIKATSKAFFTHGVSPMCPVVAQLLLAAQDVELLHELAARATFCTLPACWQTLSGAHVAFVLVWVIIACCSVTLGSVTSGHHTRGAMLGQS